VGVVDLDLVAGTAAEIWRRATSPQPPPSSVVVLGTGVVAALVVVAPATWRVTRHVVTLVHEAGHAVAAVLTGRRLAGIRLHSDTSGLTTSVGRPRGPGMVLTAVAGYVAPGLLGLAAAGMTSRGWSVGLLWALLAMLAAMAIGIRNLFGLWSVLATAAVLLAVTWWASPVWQTAVGCAVTWFLLLGAPRPVLELARTRRRGPRTSDADVLARLTRVPGGVWVGVFGGVTVGTALLGGRLLTGA
jgi:Peptidase M50B-like